MRKLICMLLLFCSHSFASNCTGHFVNPITDICWHCLFPLSIGGGTIVHGDNPDTSNPVSPVQICPMKVGWRLGMALGYWEPFATTDVTRAPYCLVNLGGLQVSISGSQHDGSSESSASGTNGSFYQVHWYKYPLIVWLNIITSVGCLQTGDYDIGYLTELDPTWDDDELGFLISPEDALFANPVSQLACAADAMAAVKGSAKNSLFWCMGSQGPSYPLTGNISAEYSPLQNSVLLSERLDYKLHRMGLLKDSNGHDGAVCHEHYTPIIPKNRYRYQMVNPRADAKSCHPFGHTTVSWQQGRLKPDDKGNFGYLIWRKRNCVFL